jgi:hypothetical protein
MRRSGQYNFRQIPKRARRNAPTAECAPKRLIREIDRSDDSVIARSLDVLDKIDVTGLKPAVIEIIRDDNTDRIVRKKEEFRFQGCVDWYTGEVIAVGNNVMESPAILPRDYPEEVEIQVTLDRPLGFWPDSEYSSREVLISGVYDPENEQYHNLGYLPPGARENLATVMSYSFHETFTSDIQ